HLFALRVGDPLISERDQTDDDQDDREHLHRLHVSTPLAGPTWNGGFEVELETPTPMAEVSSSLCNAPGVATSGRCVFPAGWEKLSDGAAGARHDPRPPGSRADPLSGLSSRRPPAWSSPPIGASRVRRFARAGPYTRACSLAK